MGSSAISPSAGTFAAASRLPKSMPAPVGKSGLRNRAPRAVFAWCSASERSVIPLARASATEGREEAVRRCVELPERFFDLGLQVARKMFGGWGGAAGRSRTPAERIEGPAELTKLISRLERV